MSTLREQAIELVNNMNEIQLFDLLKAFGPKENEPQETVTGARTEAMIAFEELEKMRRPAPSLQNADYKEVLAEALDEKYARIS